MAGRWTTVRRSLLFALPLFAGLAAPAASQSSRLNLPDRLRFARDVLCLRCGNDIEAEGVNRPMRRVLAALAVLDDVERALEATIARGEWADRGVRPALRQARLALEAVDEATAQRALRRAVRIVEAMRTDG
jgi:hypothetical protein